MTLNSKTRGGRSWRRTKLQFLSRGVQKNMNGFINYEEWPLILVDDCRNGMIHLVETALSTSLSVRPLMTAR